MGVSRKHFLLSACYLFMILKMLSDPRSEVMLLFPNVLTDFQMAYILISPDS